jgi:hypothetical protein
MKYIFFFLACLANPIFSQGVKKTADSLHTLLIKDSAHIYRFRKVLPMAAIDQRNSYINKTPVNINGFQIGVNLFEKHTLGLGFYSIIGSTHHTKTVSDKNEVLNRNLNLSYMTIFYYYPIVDRRYWEFGFPVEAGGGVYKIDVTDQNNKSYKGYPKPDAGMFVFGTGLSLTIKPIRWLGLNGMAGFRKVSDSNPNLNLNGFFYCYGVVVYVHQITMDYKFYKKKKAYQQALKMIS